MANYISDEQVREVLTPAIAFECVKNAHIALAEGTADNVVRSRARAEKMSLHCLSAASSKLGFAASKVYTATRNGVQAKLLLFSTESGDLVGVIEANELGRLRTAAASAVAGSILAPKAAKSLALIGSGFQANALAMAFAENHPTLDLSLIKVFSIKEESRENLCEALSSQTKIELRAADSIEDALENVEIIITATTSSKPVIPLGVLSATRFISAMGSNSLARAELPPRAVTAANKVVVDAIDVAQKEAGDLLSPIENGKILWSNVDELGDLLLNPPKLMDRGYSLFCSQGLAVQDLFAAQYVFYQLGGSNKANALPF
jgi:ornithine cyclodeaminase